VTSERPSTLDEGVQASIGELAEASRRGYRWLRDFAPNAFSSTLREDAGILASLAAGLPRLVTDRELVLVDRDRELTLARLDRPGSVFETLRQIEDREIAASEIFHSDAALPGTDAGLEVHRYEFASPAGAPGAAPPGEPPAPVLHAIHAAAAARHPGLDAGALEEAVRLLWAGNERWVRLAPPADVARLAWLFHECRQRGGFYLDLVESEGAGERVESTVLFAMASPPPRGFLMQITEVFNALDLGLRRSLALSADAEGQRYFLASFRVAHRKGLPLTRQGELFRDLRRQLFATQILSVESPTWRDFVLPRLMTAEEAGLVNAFIGFCHTQCAHNQTDNYTYEDVVRAFHFHPDMSLRLVRLFMVRFDPDRRDRDAAWPRELAEVEREVAAYNTGHRRLDEFRRSLFQVALTFIKRTLKTNFFVDEKHALAFRLDPAYLEDLGPLSLIHI